MDDMCDCKVGWKPDPHMPDESHNMVPVTCNEYVAALEHQLEVRIGPRLMEKFKSDFGKK